MRLTPRRPTRRRVKAYSAAGAAIGSLPIGVAPGKPKGGRLVKLLVPAAVIAILAVLIVRRRRTQAPAPDSWAAPLPDDLATNGAAATTEPETVTEQVMEQEKAEATGDDA